MIVFRDFMETIFLQEFPCHSYCLYFIFEHTLMHGKGKKENKRQEMKTVVFIFDSTSCLYSSSWKWERERWQLKFSSLMSSQVKCRPLEKSMFRSLWEVLETTLFSEPVPCCFTFSQISYGVRYPFSTTLSWLVEVYIHKVLALFITWKRKRCRPFLHPLPNPTALAHWAKVKFVYR